MAARRRRNSAQPQRTSEHYEVFLKNRQPGKTANGLSGCLPAPGEGLAKELGVSQSVNLALDGFSNKPGKTAIVVLTKSIKRALVVGGVSAAKLGQSDLRKMTAAAASALAGVPGKSAVWALVDVPVTSADGANTQWLVRNALAAVSNAFYCFDADKQDINRPSIKSVAVLSTGRQSRGIRAAIGSAQALDSGLQLARDLGNEPPNVCNPTYLLRAARKLASASKVLVRSLNEKEMTRLGMGAFMSVSQGSDTPGKMIIVQYKGGKPKEAPHVLVGKGITFDTGGISLKPGAAMDEMNSTCAAPRQCWVPPRQPLRLA